MTFPFALIPVIPNFPFFYILWRAWSHYKAWRGASYLGSLLKLGMIVEKPSPELDEVYRSTGRGATEEGSEERAPDQTSSEGVKLGVVSEKARVQEGAKSSGASELPEQAKGNGPAPDGTSTPQSMIYQPAPAMSPTSAGGKTSSPRHPSVLLGLGQAPLLAKAFGLKPNEVMDVNRALEQADGRAKAADKAKSQEGVDSERDEKQAPGTTWRGNLHR